MTVSVPEFTGGLLKRTRTMKTSERLARELVGYIVDNDLAEGTKLPNEKQLVETLGIGRTTLREALRLLETRGVITIRSGPGGGPVVRRPRPDDLSESLTLILQFEGCSLADVLQARGALEPMMARFAAERLTDDELDELAGTIQLMRANVDDHEVFLAQNAIFHSVIAREAGSVLHVFNETLKHIADGAVAGVRYTARRRLAVAAAHEKILKALRAGDADAAEETMREHVHEAGDYWRRKYPQLVTQPVRWID